MTVQNARAKADVHETVTATAVALLWLFLYSILLCDNMESNRSVNWDFKRR